MKIGTHQTLYIYVGLDPVVDGVYRTATTSTLGPTSFQKGQKLWFDLRAAGLDERLFTDPLDVDPGRPIKLYKLLHGDRVFRLLGEVFVWGVAGEVLRLCLVCRGLGGGRGLLGR